MKPRYETVHDGQWFEPKPQRGHRMRCCDCGLVHVFNFRVRHGKVQLQPRRDKRATAAARKRLGVRLGK